MDITVWCKGVFNVVSIIGQPSDRHKMVFIASWS